MYDNLLYIATHLDYYRFNTENARKLKREIEHWSTLPMDEQKSTAEDLIERFFGMFTNNPYLERHNMLKSGTIHDKPVGITAVSVEGYFNAERNPVMLREKGTQMGDGGAVCLIDHGIDLFIEQKKEDANLAVANFEKAYSDSINVQKVCYSHILNKKFSQGGSTYRSPTFIGMIITIAFYAFMTWALLGPMRIVERVKAYIEAFPILKESGFREFVLFFGKVELIKTAGCLLAALFGLFMLKGSINTIIKGAYRMVIRNRFSKTLNKRKQISTQLHTTLAPQTWYNRFSAAVRKDKSTISNDPHTPVSKLESFAMLASPNNPINTKLGLERKPWSRYRKPGEKQKVFFKLVLIAAMVLLMNI